MISSLLDEQTLLSSQQLYSVELREIEPLTEDAQHALVERARDGDMLAAHQIITALLRHVARFARRYFLTYYQDAAHLAPEDLIGVGNAALVEKIKDALWAENPFGYLLSSAQGEIRKYCHRYAGLITLPPTFGAQRATVLSLDGPRSCEKEQSLLDSLVVEAPAPACSSVDRSPLQHALEALPPSDRTLLERFYGLQGTPQETARDLARAEGVSESTFYARKERALGRLRALLSAGGDSPAPEVSKEAVPRPSVPLVGISAQRLQRLDRAYDALLAQDSEITGTRLGQEAKVTVSCACAYLKSKGHSMKRSGGISPQRREARKARQYEQMAEAFAYAMTEERTPAYA